jgi:hypothetical protein
MGLSLTQGAGRLSLLSREVSVEGGSFSGGVTAPAPRDHQSMPMPEVVPSGYISIREALNRVGRELFPSDWTGEEHKARRGLISEEEWLKTKNVPRARGSGATGSGAMLRKTVATPVTATPHATGDPADPAYQEEYRASERHAAARDRLRVLLERGDLEAVILDPWTGALHRASTAVWRRLDADRMLQAEQARLPGSPNTGSLFIKQFAEPSVPVKPLPPARIGEAIEALREKLLTGSLTRAEQADFVRQSFPNHHVAERQLRQIFQAIPARTGRPGKPDKKV